MQLCNLSIVINIVPSPNGEGTIFGPLDRIRTCDHRNRNPVLYPAELRAEISKYQYIIPLKTEIVNPITVILFQIVNLHKSFFAVCLNYTINLRKLSIFDCTIGEYEVCVRNFARRGRNFMFSIDNPEKI